MHGSPKPGWIADYYSSPAWSHILNIIIVDIARIASLIAVVVIFSSKFTLRNIELHTSSARTDWCQLLA